MKALTLLVVLLTTGCAEMTPQQSQALFNMGQQLQMNSRPQYVAPRMTTTNCSQFMGQLTCTQW